MACPSGTLAGRWRCAAAPGRWQVLADAELLIEYPRRTDERILVDSSCYEGPATDRVHAPPPLGKMGRRLQEIVEMVMASRKRTPAVGLRGTLCR